jgi:hypothetical protein
MNTFEKIKEKCVFFKIFYFVFSLFRCNIFTFDNHRRIPVTKKTPTFFLKKVQVCLKGLQVENKHHQHGFFFYMDHS